MFTTETALAYRDALPALRERLTRLVRAEHDRLPLVAIVERVRADRAGRIAGGVAGIVGIALALAAHALVGHGALTVTFLGAGAIAVATGLGVRAVLGRRAGRGLDRLLGLSGDVQRDVARVEAGDHRAELVAAVTRLEARSVAWPLVALALLAPLTLHWVVWATLLHDSYKPLFSTFDGWIGVSTVIVGHCHLLLAGLSIRYARRLARSPVPPRAAGWWAWLWTLIASIIPGVVLLGIPVLLVTLTGLCFIPLSFWMITRAVARERAALALLTDDNAPVPAPVLAG